MIIIYLFIEQLSHQNNILEIKTVYQQLWLSNRELTDNG